MHSKKNKAGLLAAFSMALGVNGADAAQMSVVEYRGGSAVLIDGEIEVGDFERFIRLFPSVDNRAHSARYVLLNSPGGWVGEALKISEYLDTNSAHMIVADGGKCASACASILFVAGKYKTVETEGLLGQHSCKIDGEPAPECNELLSQHAIANGISYGSISAFVTFVPPEEILWFSREDADCHGLTVYPLQYLGVFEKSEPCVFRVITGREAPAQIGWRVDLMNDGYEAFVRPAGDHVRELQTSVHCVESKSGKLFLTIDIGGPSEVIQQSILHGQIFGSPLHQEPRRVSVSQVDKTYSRATMEIDTAEVLPFLRHSSQFQFRLNMQPGYQDIVVTTSTAGSFDTLLFAAHNCAS